MNMQYVDVSGNCPYSCTWNGKKLILDCPTLNVQAKGYNEYELAQNLQGELKRALEKSSDFQRLVKLLPYVKCTDCVSSGVNRPIQTDATTAAGIADEIAKRIYEKLLFNIGEHRLREAEDYLAGQQGLWEQYYIWNPPLKCPRHADESNKERYDPKLELLKWQTKKNHQEWLEKQKLESQEAAGDTKDEKSGDTLVTGAGPEPDDDKYVPPGSPIRTADCLIALGEQFKNAVAGWLDKRKEDPAKFEKSKHDREEIIKKELERFAQQERERLELEQKLVKMLAPSPGVSFEEAVALWEKAWQERLQGTQGDLYAKALADLMQKLQEKNATPEQTLRAKKLLLASLEHFVARNDDEYLPAAALNLNLVDEALELGMSSDDPVQSWLQVLGRALLNFVPSAAKLVAGIAELLKSPGATLEALGKLIAGFFVWKSGLQTGEEKFFLDAYDAVVQHLASRYGSIERLKEAIATDPVGVALEIVMAVQIAKKILQKTVGVGKEAVKEKPAPKELSSDPKVIAASEKWGEEFPDWLVRYQRLKENPIPAKYKELISEQRIEHILLGDGPNAGGHLWPPAKGKTAFPKDWSPEKIMEHVTDIATEPNVNWVQQTGAKGATMTKGSPKKPSEPVKWVLDTEREGVSIRVVIKPYKEGCGIITAYPLK